MGTSRIVRTEQGAGEAGHEAEGGAGQLHVVSYELLALSIPHTGGHLPYALTKLRPVDGVGDIAHCAQHWLVHLGLPGHEPSSLRAQSVEQVVETCENLSK